MIGDFFGEPCTGEVAQRKIDNILEKLVGLDLIAILASKDYYFWLSLDRRLPPCDGITRHYKNEQSAQLCKLYMNNVIRKYSSNQKNGFRKDIESEYEEIHFFAIYECELIGVFLQTIGLLRRISSKGGYIYLDEFGKVQIEKSDILEKSLSTFDNDIKNSSWTGYLGLSKNIVETKYDGKILENDYLIGITPNGLGLIEENEKEFGKVILKFPNCYPSILKGMELHQLSGELDPVFQTRIGIDLMTWIKCLAGVSEYFVGAGEEVAIQRLFKTGYVNAATSAICGTVDPLLNQADFKKFLSHATFSKFKALDLLELKHNYFIHEIGEDALLIDGYLIYFYLIRTMVDIYKIASSSNDRGKLLERQIARFGKLIGYESVMSPGFKLKNDGIVIAEIDYSVMSNRKLGLLDAKSLLPDFDAIEGSWDEVSKRIEKLRSLLHERDAKTKLIANNPVGGNYSLDFDYAYSHLISPNIEWLPLDDNFFWYAEGIPRVSTIEIYFERVMPFIEKLECNHNFFKIKR
ncbi:MAG: hypothetical protein WA160_06845 [Pseudobdellovibrio sp.]